MRARLSLVLPGLIALLVTSTGHAQERHPLWTLEGKHNTVYLLGSIHVLRPGDGSLPEVAERAYEDAERLVMEIDLDDPGLADPAAMLGRMQAAALLPEGQTLRQVLGTDYAAISAHARQSGIDLALLDRFAPWFVATLLMQAELARHGFLPELGIEQQIAGRAMKEGKPIVGLETAEEQFAVLAGLTLPEQKRFLLMTLEESAELDEQVETLLEAWRSGDTAALGRALSEEFESFPELYRPLTEDRNRAWLDDLVDLLDDRDDYLVVVGALHLVGRNSVVDLLRQRGYTVTQH
jgi:uncharacterized protein YbaP (TraB family)